jgi:hypothetical protein
MKRIAILLLAGTAIFGASSCKKYLNVNTNPNAATYSTPDLVLPQSIVYTSALTSSFNNYGSITAGYAANAGGYGGFGSVWTYDYSTTDNTGLWSSSYDVLEDLQYVITSTAGNDAYSYFNAAARILKAYNFQRLVDEYNSIPYSKALQGSNAITPAYDDPKTIYPALAVQLDSAVAIINNAKFPTALTSATDPLFAGNETTWKQFANTIKLRLLIRASGVSGVTFANTTFDPAGFLATDAVVNPGYGKVSGQQNPSWNSWVTSYTNSAATRSYIPAQFVFGYYNGQKLTDPARGRAIYYVYPQTPTNQMGIGTVSVPNAPATAGAWYSATAANIPAAAGLGNNIGVMKGYDMGEPLMLAAESYFLQAEANIRGIVSGTAKTNFVNGIKASFAYLYKLPNGTTKTGYSAPDSANAYIAANTTSYLVNFDLALTAAQQTEAIITQKYIALNFINGDEAWNEYRRTKYPVSSTVVTNNPYGSFASTLSSSTRPDKLPVRLQYPSSEYSYNTKNTPTGISSFTSLIFWAQ